MKRQQQRQFHPGVVPHRSSAAAPLVVELGERDFASSIDGHPFAVVDFWAPSVAACRDFAPIYAAAAARHPDVLFAKVNAEEQKAILAQFTIRSIPLLMIFRSNVIVHAKPGSLTAADLDELLAAVRALDMAQVKRQVASVDTVELGVPDADHRPSVERLLRPSIRAALVDAAPRLAAGGLVAIRDAFEPDFAERMHRSLDSCTTWRLHEGYEDHFHYHHHNLYRADEFPADLARCSELFDSPGTKAWMSRLSGRPCPGPVEFSASWYLPDDHSLPHNDVGANGANSNRQVAFVWHLAKDWRSEWGGALYWCAKDAYLPPAFNTLYLFNVGPASTHFVTHVSPYAQGKRLAVNGWWTGPAGSAHPAARGPDRVGAADIAVY